MDLRQDRFAVHLACQMYPPHRVIPREFGASRTALVGRLCAADPCRIDAVCAAIGADHGGSLVRFLLCPHKPPLELASLRSTPPATAGRRVLGLLAIALELRALLGGERAVKFMALHAPTKSFNLFCKVFAIKRGFVLRARVCRRLSLGCVYAARARGTCEVRARRRAVARVLAGGPPDALTEWHNP